MILKNLAGIWTNLDEVLRNYGAQNIAEKSHFIGSGWTWLKMWLACDNS